mgnify:CR=1 FL=1
MSASSSTKDEKHYECELCKDTEWIFDMETNSARPCKCREAKLYRRIIENCGISKAFLEKTFDNFKPITKDVNIAFNTAKDYVLKFETVKGTKNNSIALLGQVGSGKTHLSIAIANEFMKRNIGVRYMQYREDITRIKQVITDEEDYNKELNKYKNATVLLIDDLYKGAISNKSLNDSDKRIMFEIVNYRYFKGSPIIVSSECRLSQMLELDEGIGSRILEMCKGHIAEIIGRENNYRLRKEK